MYLYQPDKELLARQIKKYKSAVRGRVLDVGAGRTKRYDFDCDEYVRMDIEKWDGIDVVGRAEKIPLPDNSFDTVVCFQVLGDVEYPYKAIRECYRVLRPGGGTILLTESMMEENHNEVSDSWRFTRIGMERLFQKAGFKDILIEKRGGYFSLTAQMRVRYIIDKFRLYECWWARYLNPAFKVYASIMFFLDKIDHSPANQKYAIAWLVLAKK